MNRVKCANGHFYDADRFQICPICGVEPAEKSKLRSELVKKPVDGIPQTVPLRSDPETDGEPVEVPRIQKRIDELAPTELLQPGEDIRLEERIAEEREEICSKTASCVAKDGIKPVQQKLAPSSLSAAVAGTGSKSISALPKTVSYYDMNETDPPVGWLVCTKGPYRGKAFECKVGRNRIGRSRDLEICLIEDAAITREPHAILIYEPKQRLFYLQAGTGDGLAYCNGNLLFAHEELHPYDEVSIGTSEFVFLPLCGERFAWDEYIAKG